MKSQEKLTVSPGYLPAVELLLAGRFDALNAASQADTNGMAPWEIAYLKATAEFQTGKLWEAAASRPWEICVWLILTRPLLLRAARGALATVHALLRVLGCDHRVFASLHRKYGPNVIHLRYTQFHRLTWQALLLTAFATEQAAYGQAYYEGMLGHALCEAGRFDLGLVCLQRALISLRAKLAAESSVVIYQQFCEVLALTAVHEAYAGNLSSSGTLFNELLAGLQIRPYFWIELFARAMRLASSVEMLDEQTMFLDSQRLKQMLGATFAKKYGLRTAVYSALFAALRMDFQGAREQLLSAEDYFARNVVHFELGRYHLIRALVELEFLDPTASRHHASRSQAFLSLLPGAVLPQIDAELLDIEIALMSQFISPSAEAFSHKVRNIERRLQRISRRMVGAPIFTTKVQVLTAFLNHLRARRLDDHAALRRLRGECEQASRRFLLLLSRFDPRWDGPKQPLPSRALFDRKRDESILELLTAVTADEDPEEASKSLVKVIFGANRVDFARRPHIGKHSDDMFYITHRSDASTHSVAIPLSRDEELLFNVTQPLSDITFDGKVNRYLELVAAILRAKSTRKTLMEAERFKAVARTTQMLAHDVRKPFTMMQTILDGLRDAKTLGDTRELILAGSSEVRAAVTAVTAMLHDVMEIGAESRLATEDVAAEALIEAVLREVCRIYPYCEVQFDYALADRRLLRVDSLKCQRVMSNIVANAVQAMSLSGRIWFRSSVVDHRLTEFRIGNAGSYIAQEHIASLFDAFFTMGKRGGTGLGLAIAKKIVEAHGGTIRCESDRSRGVEFILTLPVADGQEAGMERVPTLPLTSGHVHQSFAVAGNAAAGDEMGESTTVAALESLILDSLGARRLSIVILDDEAIYRNALVSLIRSCQRLSLRVDLHLATSGSEAIAFARAQPDFGIFDCDLGSQSQDGIAVLAEVRHLAPKMRVCMHSNRTSTTHYKLALAAGAASFLPKPMGKAHLLKFISDHLPREVAPPRCPFDVASDDRTRDPFSSHWSDPLPT